MNRCECGTIEPSPRSWRLQMDMCRSCYANWKKAQLAAKVMRNEIKSVSK
ncbi:hypothetical protein [Brevibacillus brevis]|nr:hypothetical protein [Lysinibacillus sp. SDF0063]